MDPWLRPVFNGETPWLPQPAITPSSWAGLALLGRSWSASSQSPIGTRRSPPAEDNYVKRLTLTCLHRCRDPMLRRGGSRTVRRATVRVLVVAVASWLVACGGTGSSGAGPVTSRAVTPTPTPSAAEILTKPALSTIKDMHFTATVRTTSSGQTAELTGEGDMVVRPSSAFRLKVQGIVGGASVSEEIITKSGTDYVRQGEQKFKASPSSQASDVNTWQDAGDATLLGEEGLPTGNAWHVKANSKQGNAFEAWVRKTDGYLLRYFATSKSGNTTFAYAMVGFNTGVVIEAPPPNDVI